MGPREGLAISALGDAVVQRDDNPIAFQTTDLDSGRRLASFAWEPGVTYQVRVGSEVRENRTPLRPTPYLLRTIALEDASRAALAGVSPDSVVRFAPDSRRLAIGTLAGRLRVLDCYSGEPLFETRIAEGLIKCLEWSPDGSTLYVGEQSPDAYLVAYHAPIVEGNTRAPFAIAWRIRLADRIETSPLSAADRYAVYTLPAVHDLAIAADGRIFVAATHNWSGASGSRNRSCLLCTLTRRLGGLVRSPNCQLGADHLAPGDRRDRRARAGAAASHPSAAQRGGSNSSWRADAVGWSDRPPARCSDDRAPGAAFRVGRSVGFGGAGRRRLAGRDRAGRWSSLAVRHGRRTSQAAADVRASHAAHRGNDSDRGGSYTLRIFGERVYFETQNTHIPFGSMQAANQAPVPHHGANTLSVTDLAGAPLWRYRGPFNLTGSWCDGAGHDKARRWLLVTCREQPGAGESAQFGGLLFDLERPGGGNDKLAFYYPTAGPVIFNADISRDGRLIALVEIPAPTPDGRALFGTHQVHVLH